MRALARLCLVGHSGLQVFAGGHRRTRAESLPERELEAGVRGRLAGETQSANRAGLHVDPERAQEPPHVTLQLSWRSTPSVKTDAYRRLEKRLTRSTRQRHFAGKRLFVDYAACVAAIDGRSGE